MKKLYFALSVLTACTIHTTELIQLNQTVHFLITTAQNPAPAPWGTDYAGLATAAGWNYKEEVPNTIPAKIAGRKTTGITQAQIQAVLPQKPAAEPTGSEKAEAPIAKELYEQMATHLSSMRSGPIGLGRKRLYIAQTLNGKGLDQDHIGTIQESLLAQKTYDECLSALSAHSDDDKDAHEEGSAPASEEKEDTSAPKKASLTIDQKREILAHFAGQTPNLREILAYINTKGYLQEDSQKVAKIQEAKALVEKLQDMKSGAHQDRPNTEPWTESNIADRYEALMSYVQDNPSATTFEGRPIGDLLLIKITREIRQRRLNSMTMKNFNALYEESSPQDKILILTDTVSSHIEESDEIRDDKIRADDFGEDDDSDDDSDDDDD